MEVDDYISLLFAMNCSPDHETEYCKWYRLVYLFYTALYVESVVMFIEYCFVVMIEKIRMAGQFVVLVAVDKRDFHHLFRQ